MKTRYQKNLNFRGYDEYFIKEPELMNSCLASGDKVRNETSTESAFVTCCDNVHKSAYTFSLYKHVEDIELIDQKKAMAMARGYYSSYFASLYPKTNIPKEFYNCLGALNYANPNTQMIEYDNVYVYDKNSAYLSILKDGYYPDVDAGDLGCGYVKTDEIGFEVYGDMVILVKEGEWASVKFKKAKSKGLIKFANSCYSRLGLFKANGERERATELKQAIVACIGIIRNHNIWFYAYIVNSCRYEMESLINEKTLICNTDSVISIGKREDLSIGKKLGQFKIEYEQVNFIHRGTNYKIYDKDNLYKLAYRGYNKAAQNASLFEQTISIYEPDFGYSQGNIGDFIYEKNNNT